MEKEHECEDEALYSDDKNYQSKSVKTIVSNFHTILKIDNNILSMQYMLGTILSAL